MKWSSLVWDWWDYCDLILGARSGIGGIFFFLALVSGLGSSQGQDVLSLNFLLYREIGGFGCSGIVGVL